MNGTCPDCGTWLVNYLVDYTVTTACPFCKKVVQANEIVQSEPDVPMQIKQFAHAAAAMAIIFGLAIAIDKALGIM